jgi:hypothetical protein
MRRTENICNTLVKQRKRNAKRSGDWLDGYVDIRRGKNLIKDYQKWKRTLRRIIYTR